MTTSKNEANKKSNSKTQPKPPSSSNKQNKQAKEMAIHLDNAKEKWMDASTYAYKKDRCKKDDIIYPKQKKGKRTTDINANDPENTEERKTIVSFEDILGYSNYAEHHLEMKLHTKKHILNREIPPNNILNRPGMCLFNFYESFAYDRIQIIGQGEYAYLQKLNGEGKLDHIAKIFRFEIPCFIFSHNNVPPKKFIEMAEESKIPVCVSSLRTEKIIEYLHNILANIIAPKITLHGVMMEIYGMGVFITGADHIGKSECALELMNRGHIFIADDVVEISIGGRNMLIGRSSKIVRHHMIVNGIGIINIAHLFGVRAIRMEKTLDMCVYIEEYDDNKNYERIGIDTDYIDILNVSIPKITLPISAGSNTPMLIETATMNQRLKASGYNTAKEFNKKIMNFIEKGEDIF